MVRIEKRTSSYVETSARHVWYARINNQQPAIYDFLGFKKKSNKAKEIETSASMLLLFARKNPASKNQRTTLISAISTQFFGPSFTRISSEKRTTSKQEDV